MNTIAVDYEQATLSTRLANFRRSLPWLVRSYVISLFPIFQWIHQYNLSWLVQDMIAGITTGIVAVPQAIAYAKIAGLEPQYGLYTSFVGVSLYCFFGTSKDISIGMISTLSLLLGDAIIKVTQLYPDEITGPQVATTLCLTTGIITLGIGISRLGILVDFIPHNAIHGYMTGSSIIITSTQLPKLFGITQINTHNTPYLVIVDFLKHISLTQLDVAFGMTALVLLYTIRFGCQYLSSRPGLPSVLQRPLFYFGIMRNGLVVLLGTLISFAVNRGRDSVISIIRDVPAGFDAIAVPVLDTRIISATSAMLPSMVIIMILEHVSVAKSFGRVYGYNIDPNQEIFAIGFSNIIGSFFGSTPATGAFSRTAIMAKSGVRTPAGGVFSGIIVLLALYVLTPCFYYIPDAILSAVVIHAVADLVSSPHYLKQLLKTNIWEFLVWLSAVVMTIFVDVQTGIYTAVGLSLVIMLFRLARPPVKMLVRLPVPSTCIKQQLNEDITEDHYLLDGKCQRQHYVYVDERQVIYDRQCYPMPSGLLVFRFTESMLYPNAEFVSETIIRGVKSRTRSGNIKCSRKMNGELPWNQAMAKNDSELHRHQLPVLRALVLDFTAVRRLDSTSLHTLVDLRNSVNVYAGGDVEWHFVGLQNGQLRRDLIYYGFGVESGDHDNNKVCNDSDRNNNNNGNNNNHGSSSGSNESVFLDEKQHQRKSGSSGSHVSLPKMATSLDGDLEIGLAHYQQRRHEESSHADRGVTGKLGKQKLSNPGDSKMSDAHCGKYSYFHWDVDSAVHSIWKRWNTADHDPS